MASAPVALIIFNRPIETARVFAAIREAKPDRLLVIADGPRTDAERSLTDAARAVIQVDWHCIVEKNYAEKNMGCRDRIISGLNWLFERAERAIILEDDCLPDATFFPFCEELLERYKYDERVMTITGLCLFEKQLGRTIKESYCANLVPQTTGWATWSRAWKKHDPDMRAWPQLRRSQVLVPVFDNHGGYERFEHIWDEYYHKSRGVKDSWDGAWAFTTIAHEAVCLTPTVNLISNIGFNERATHTRGTHAHGNIPLSPMRFPLMHPRTLAPNRTIDAFYYRHAFNVDTTWYYRLVRPLKAYVPGLYRTLKAVFKKD